MSKHNKQTWFDWTEPRAGKDEGDAVQKIAGEIERLTIAGYSPPTPISSDSRKDDLTESARRREKQRETEHDAALEALSREEKRLRRQEKRLAQLAEERESDQRKLVSAADGVTKLIKERRDRESTERRQSFQAEAERRNAAIRGNLAAHAQYAQRRRDEHIKDLEQITASLDRWINPPAPAEREIIYVESDEPPAAGALPTLPRWR
jgi:DNA repair exonuclease SbcCD ATPase subunit